MSDIDKSRAMMRLSGAGIIATCYAAAGRSKRLLDFSGQPQNFVPSLAGGSPVTVPQGNLPATLQRCALVISRDSMVEAPAPAPALALYAPEAAAASGGGGATIVILADAADAAAVATTTMAVATTIETMRSTTTAAIIPSIETTAAVSAGAGITASIV